MSDTFYGLMQKYSDEDKAREYVESLRWPDGTVCPHCDSNRAYKLVPKEGSKTRKGLWKCNECRKQFTVTVGTIFEDSRIPLSKWVIAIHLFCSSKKGISAHQIHRMLDITYKSAWFMMHRIRYVVENETVEKLEGVIEIDETYVGGKAKNMHKVVREQKIKGRGSVGKAAVITMVERDGRVKSQHTERVTETNLKEVMQRNIDTSSNIMTDEFKSYTNIGAMFNSHETVNHKSGEYVRIKAHINTAESVHALLKRGVYGIYHHWSVKHLHRYLSEFDFRFSLRRIEDGDRSKLVFSKVSGKRLEYKDLIN